MQFLPKTNSMASLPNRHYPPFTPTPFPFYFPFFHRGYSIITGERLHDRFFIHSVTEVSYIGVFMLSPHCFDPLSFQQQTRRCRHAGIADKKAGTHLFPPFFYAWLVFSTKSLSTPHRKGKHPPRAFSVCRHDTARR